MSLLVNAYLVTVWLTTLNDSKHDLYFNVFDGMLEMLLTRKIHEEFQWSEKVFFVGALMYLFYVTIKIRIQDI